MRIKSCLFFFLLFIITNSHGQAWESLGPNDLSQLLTNQANECKIAVSSAGTPYIAYVDVGKNWSIVVKRYNGSAWVDVGTSIVSGASFNSVALAVDANGNPYVAYSDPLNHNGVSVKKFDGSAWAYVGSPGFSGTIGAISIAIHSGIPYVGYAEFENTTAQATVKRFIGNNWVTVGSPHFTENHTERIDLAFDNSGILYIAYGISQAGVGIKRLSGSSWVNVGTGFPGDYPAIAFNGNVPYIAFMDHSNGYGASVKRFISGAWTDVGSPNFSNTYVTSTDIIINNSGTPYVMYQDYYGGLVSVVKSFNGTNWIDVAGGIVSESNSHFQGIARDGNGIPYVVFQDLAKSYSPTVKKLVGNSWTELGKTISISTGRGYLTSIDVDSTETPYIVFWDEGKGTFVKKYSQNSWLSVGNALTPNSTDYNFIAIDKKGTPFVCYKESYSVVKKWSGSSWVNVGSPTVLTADFTSLAFDKDNSVYICYRGNSTSSKANVKKFDGVNWTSVGSADFSVGQSDFPSISIYGDTPFVVYKDWGLQGKAVVKKYNGSSWVNVGPASISPGEVFYTDITTDPQGVPFVAYFDLSLYKVVVKKFTGGAWVDVGNMEVGNGEFINILFGEDGVLYVGYKDWKNNMRAVVKRFNGAEWEVVGEPGFSAGRSDYFSLAIKNNKLLSVYSTAGVFAKRFSLFNFTGSGNWSDSTNWGGKMMPPSIIPAGCEVIINPAGGTCILDIPLTVNDGSKVIVRPGKELKLNGNLTINK